MNKIIIFGCGKMAKKTYKYIDKKKNNILCYIDNDAKKWGGKCLGKNICPPDQIVKLEYDYILIASYYWREMKGQLLEFGVSAKKIRCLLAPVKRKKFEDEYGEIYNILGKFNYYYGKWYLKEQFKPDWWGVLVNPYFFSRRKLYENITKYSHYMTGKCMDFGCGIQPYKRLLPAVEYVGVEIETENKRKGVIYYDGHKLPFKNEVFDSVISSQVFEHVANIDEIVVELKRVLKSGGVMLITVPFAYPRHCEPFDYRRWTLQGIKIFFEEAGFEFIESEASSGYWECIAQFKNVYWAEEVKAMTISCRIFKTLSMIYNNIAGGVVGRILPYSDKLYLDNVIVVRKGR